MFQRHDDTGKGVWYNFETNESGDMLDLIKQVKNFSSTRDLQHYVHREILPQLQQLEANQSCDNQNTFDEALARSKAKVNIYVNKIISELRPLKGTPAETYLKKTRKLTNLPPCSSLKYHPNLSTKDKHGGWLTQV